MSMTCRNVKSNLEELLLAPGQAPQAVREHLAACESCRRELADLEATLALLDDWKAPEVTPYFPVRMQALLRAEQQARPAGWVERWRARLLFGDLQLRPLAAGALALLLLIGGGTYAGVESLTSHPTATAALPASATVRDLQSLDENAQVFQQINALDQSDDSDMTPSGSI
jgi:anti-sigma factor RsiW